MKPLFVDVVFTRGELDFTQLWTFDFVAVIDVLRATTVMVTALENGARAVVPVATPEEAVQLAERVGASADGGGEAEEGASFPGHGPVLLGGERQARRIPGFHVGNSPLEYTPANVKGKTVALATTNGTRAFRQVQTGTLGLSVDSGIGPKRPRGDWLGPTEGRSPVVVAACLRNAAAVARLVAAAEKKATSVPPSTGQSAARARVAERAAGPGAASTISALLVCAGTDGRFSGDDAFCAGVVVAELSQRAELTLGDGARAAWNMIGRPPARSKPSASEPWAWSHAYEQLAKSRHGRRLLGMGLEEDVRFCAETNVSDVVPRLFMGMLVWQADEGTDAGG